MGGEHLKKNYCYSKLIAAGRMLVGCSSASRQCSHGPAVALEFFAFWQRLQFSSWDPLVCRNPHGRKARMWALCWKIIWLTPRLPPTPSMYKMCVLLVAICLPCRGLNAKPFLELWSLKASWRMVSSSQKGLVLQPHCHERNLSVEKIQLKCLRYLFCPFTSLPPTLDREVREPVCGAVL